MLDQRSGTYLTLDRPDVLEQAIADPLGVATTARSGLTVIDDIQLAPELLRAVKLAVDRDESPGAFLLTGSANLLRMRNVSETLAGRAVYVELGPLSLSERLRQPSRNVIEQALAASSAEEFLSLLPVTSPDRIPSLRQAVTDAVVSGGMPGTLDMDAATRRHRYSSYISTFVERDLRQLGSVGDISAFRRLFALSMLRTSGLLTRADLAAGASLDHRTCARYLDLLEVSYQLRTLTPYAATASKRLVKSPKLHARDSGMASHVARVEDWLEAMESGAAGALFETWMLSELLATDVSSGGRPSAHFWRTSAGSEVDVVFERGSAVTGFEMKVGATVRWSDTRGLAAMRDALGEQFRMGVIAYLGDEMRVLDDRICAAPAWSLLGLGDDAVTRLARSRTLDTPGPGAILTRARTAQGRRTEEIAALLGVDVGTVEQWERSAYEEASLKAIRKIAEELGIVVRFE